MTCLAIGTRDPGIWKASPDAVGKDSAGHQLQELQLLVSPAFSLVPL